MSGTSPFGNSSKNDGTALERIVAWIESCSLPKGYATELRRRVYDDQGRQIAELDIVISGNLGSTDFQMLIECRDRPSEGPAPVAWIEQLRSRKDRLGMDKVMAVSSQGFSQAAVDYAERERIKLRTLTTLSDDDIKAQLPRTGAPLLWQLARPVGFNVYLDLPEGDASEVGLIGRSLITEQVIRNNESGIKSTLAELFGILQQQSDLYQGVPEDGVEREVTMPLKLASLIGESSCGYSANACGDWAEVESVTVTAMVRLQWASMPLAQVQRYIPELSAGGQKPHAEVWTWDGDERDFIKSFTMIAFPRTDK